MRTRILCRYTLTMVVGFGLALGVGGCSEERPLPTIDPDATSLLLVVFDALDASHVTHLGYHRPTTPNLDALAADGISYATAFAPAPYTLASIPSMMTGRRPDTHGVTEKSRSLPPDELTLAERLKGAGYRTYAAVSNPNGSSFFGMAQGFDSFLELFRPEGDRERIDDSGALKEGSDKPREAFEDKEGFGIPNAEAFAEAVKTWTADRRKGEKSFYYLHIMEPHWPYTPPEPFRSQFLDPEFEGVEELNDRIRFQLLPGEEQSVTELEQSALIDLYDGNIAYADWALGQIIAQLESKSFLDEFMIVVTSDHGEAFWQHDVQGHNLQLFDEMVHVPLVIRFPKGEGPRGEKVVHLASLLDLVPSLCDWMELGIAGPTLDGLPLSIVAAGAAPDRELILRTNDRNPTLGIRSQQRKTIGKREPRTGAWHGARHFDLSTDPLELEPLHAENVTWSDDHREKLSLLYEQIQETNRTGHAQREEELTPEALDLLNDLGYVE